MTYVLAMYSHSGGTGKSTFATNLATVLATEGQHVCLVDTDIQSPGVHVLLDIAENDVMCTLSDFLLGECEIDDAVHDASGRLPEGATGSLCVVPSKLNSQVIAAIVGGGYDAGLLDEGLRMLIDRRAPDVMVLDTQSGLNNEAMVALAAADCAVIVMRFDEQESRGASVATAVADRMEAPRTAVVVNMVSDAGDPDRVREFAESAYGRTVEAVLPHTPELAGLASCGVFVLEYPDHPYTEQFRLLAKRLFDDVATPTDQKEYPS